MQLTLETQAIDSFQLIMEFLKYEEIMLCSQLYVIIINLLLGFCFCMKVPVKH